ncbi:TolB family protein [Luteimonas aquatica]|uniref:TolB family protein n=1 Tax=Luteimonas aquatica TaxID=450364 RepID=UPI001F564144|nr:TolB-like protein [Luteimonas aquatica]
MRVRRWGWALTALACGTAAAALQEFGIEGMGVVSTPSAEVRAAVRPDGQHIVWGSRERAGGAGSYDLWQADKRDGRWADARPLSINTPAKEFDPFFSADGKWLYFFSDRAGGHGGDDLYRAAVLADGNFGAPENLGPGVNGKGNEWAPALTRDGMHLLFASDSFGGAGGHDLLMARWDGKAFVDPQPVPGVNTAGDEFDAAWIEDGKAIVFAYAKDIMKDPVRLMLAQCDGKAYVDPQPWALSFNGPEDNTYGPAVDPSKPGEMLVNGMAKAPKAGKQDIYRVRTPAVTGKDGCVR